jgi:hypothetical protein
MHEPSLNDAKLAQKILQRVVRVTYLSSPHSLPGNAS